ncbi:MAG TPA: phosphate signaling complex protein PhoU [Caulobacteraceae bacterium]|jgi:phosphate transport system protein
MTARAGLSASGEELDQLSADVARMGGLAEAQVVQAVDCVARRDVALARAVIARDEKLDILQRELERKAMRIILARPLEPAELGHALAAMKFAHTLERTGDYARNIARRGIIIAEADPLTPLTRSTERMGKLVVERLKTVLDAYTASDLDLALQVWREDQEVDEHFNSLFRELVAHMTRDPGMVTPCAHLLFVGKNLERIGDHATNLAEIIHHELTGEEMMTERPRGESVVR